MSYVLYRLLSLPMTLSELQGHFSYFLIKNRCNIHVLFGSLLRKSVAMCRRLTLAMILSHDLIVGWKPIIDFLDSFRNKSGKQQPIRTKVATHAQVKGRQRSRNFGRDRLSGGGMGAKKCVFFVGNTRRLFGNFATADFHQIWPRYVNREWNADFGQKFMKSFHSGVICPQNPKLWGSQTGTSLRAGYRSRDTL